MKLEETGLSKGHLHTNYLATKFYITIIRILVYVEIFS